MEISIPEESPEIPIKKHEHEHYHDAEYTIFVPVTKGNPHSDLAVQTRMDAIKSIRIKIGLEKYKMFTMEAVPLKDHFLSARRALESKAMKIQTQLTESKDVEIFESPHDEHKLGIELMAAGLYDLFNNIHPSFNHHCVYKHTPCRYIAVEEYEKLWNRSNGHIQLIVPLTDENRENPHILDYLVDVFQNLYDTVNNYKKRNERFSPEDSILLG